MVRHDEGTGVLEAEGGEFFNYFVGVPVELWSVEWHIVEQCWRKHFCFNLVGCEAEELFFE